MSTGPAGVSAAQTHGGGGTELGTEPRPLLCPESLHGVGMGQPWPCCMQSSFVGSWEHGRKGSSIPGPGGALKLGEGLGKGFDKCRLHLTSESSVCFLRPLCPSSHCSEAPQSWKVTDLPVC